MENLGTAILASSIVILALLVLMGLVALLLNWRKTKAQREFFADLHTSLAPGKRVMFAGGIYGTVSKVGTDVVQVKVAGGIALDVSRYAIQQIVDGEVS